MNEDILDFLKSNNICVVSVLRPDGLVHGATLHFSNDADASEFYFATDKHSRKVEGLMEGSKTKASVVIGFNADEMITLQMDGDVRVANDDELLKVMETHYTKHPSASRFKDNPNTVHLIFKPDWWRFSKYKESPPVFIESKQP